MSLPRYSKYKNSLSSWHGMIPMHWNVFRLKSVLSVPLKYGANEAADDDNRSNPRFVRITDIEDNGELRDETFRSLSQELAQDFLLEDGDILLARSGATVGKSFIYRRSWGICCFAGYLISARVNRKIILPEFAYACLRSSFYWKHISSVQIQATIQNVSAEKYAELLLPVPPITEQVAISDFLDCETTKIDTLVAEQEKLVALLAEKRQATISHAVTKGLNPDAPMKNSGLPWIGEVPVHWDVVGLTKYLDSVVDYRGRTPEKVDEGVFLVTAKNIRNGVVDYDASQEYIGSSEYDEVMRRGKPLRGDVLFTTEAPLGQVAIVDREDIALAQRIIKFRASPAHLLNAYLKVWIMSSACQFNLEQLATGSTALGIKGSKIGQVRLCLPPLDEQEAIVSFVDTEVVKLDKLKREAELAIKLLSERRTALITAAVTGQIDVRGAIPRVAVEIQEAVAA